MSNESDNIESPNDEELSLDLDTEETLADEAKPDKPVETPEAKLARLKRQVAQQEKKLGTKTEVKPDSKPTSSEFDYGAKAFLVASGIKGDEIGLAQEIMKKTGLELDELVEDDYFQAKLKNFREAKASKEAIPTGTKRSAPSPKDSTDYWLKKPFDEVPADMKQKVLNERIKLEKDNSMFSNNSIVSH